MCIAGKIARGGGREVREGLGMAWNQWLIINNFLSPNANQIFYINDTKNIKNYILQEEEKIACHAPNVKLTSIYHKKGC